MTIRVFSDQRAMGEVMSTLTCGSTTVDLADVDHIDILERSNIIIFVFNDGSTAVLSGGEATDFRADILPTLEGWVFLDESGPPDPGAGPALDRRVPPPRRPALYTGWAW